MTVIDIGANVGVYALPMSPLNMASGVGGYGSETISSKAGRLNSVNFRQQSFSEGFC